MLGAVRGVLDRESLAARAAVTSLCPGIAAVPAEHPEVAREPGMRRLLAAVTRHRGPESVRALRALFRDRGAQRPVRAHPADGRTPRRPRPVGRGPEERRDR
ncbi:hypothetical protein [Streptomyces sp. MUSC 14]|uniref:hypothetical protein n=1 Tax=Streptomyces sp. MUSC 14 TaxID=1354889 RepID=UPI00116048A5|nr:hypothetical protein [Streptomyces sp. MUSC 14]